MGKKEGDIQVFKKNGVPSAYMWKTIDHKWEYVGEVVDPNAGQGGGNVGMVEKPKFYPGDAMFEEGEYDHVFDVELGDNVMRKLPFNNGGNALLAAEKFCVRESLGRANIEQIRTFVTQHSQPFETRQIKEKKELVQSNEVDNTMRTHLFYDAVKIDGPKKKILEFNAAASFMDDKELKHFESLCEVLASKEKFFLTKINDYHNALLTKLIQLPVDKVFPCLDLYRIFLTHPDATVHSKKFEEGANHLYSLLSPLSDKQAGDPAKMLACRCICNLFKEQTSIFVLREKRKVVVDALAPHLQNPKSTVRESAITTLLNFSIIFLMKDDHDGRMQVLEALCPLANKEKDEQCLKRLETAVKNLVYKDYQAKKMADDAGFKM